jgi:acetoin utilization deacetylase AcuC-like enzyme
VTRTGFVWHERYAWHDTGTFAGFLPSGGMVQPHLHVESPESKQRLAHLVEVSGLLDRLERVPARAATRAELLRVHTAAHVDRVAAASAQVRGGLCEDGESPIGHGSFEIALLAAGGVIAAVDAVAEGRVRNAYALVRPPGHHALPDAGVGFCLFANLPVAIAHARAVHGVERVAVVDWDVHHGNGAQAIYARDPATLAISLHQDRCYPPDSGLLTDRGEGPGLGATVNIPLPPGSGNAAYLSAFDRVVVPALRVFGPDLICVASGFDANVLDPMARMMLTSSTYRAMTAALGELAGELCDGRLVMAHEGGYSAAYVPFCGLAVLEALSGLDTGVADPWEPIYGHIGGQDLQPHQADLIAQAERLLTAVPTR